MEKDAGISLKELNANGGISANVFVVQFLADLLHKNVCTSAMPDISALGAAYLAGLHASVYENIDVLKKLNTDKKQYQPNPQNSSVQQGYAGWKKEIAKN